MHIASMHPAGYLVLSVATWLATACASAPTGTRSFDESDKTRAAIHLLNRATYGPRPQDVAEVLRIGTNTWLDRQLKPAPARATPPAVASPAPNSEQAQERTVMVNGQQVTVRALTSTQQIGDLVRSKLDRAVRSERQLEEVMTDFWFNHFNVFYNKGQVRLAIADYEQHVIRPHVFGRFEDMLIATAQHPAMLVYLDNFQSTAPSDSTPPQRIGVGQPQRRGLNENYARELLELHTLGADRGYTQDDVIAVARAFTGWSIANVTVRLPQAPVPAPARTQPQMQLPPVGAPPPPRPVMNVAFQFQRERHDPGEKIVLGKVLPRGRGMEDGLDVLRMLARHPATAEHIAEKLVRHFVADDPPQDLVNELAAVFRKTDGDLRAVTRALFTANAFYDPVHYRGKVKRPFEYVVSALRVMDAKLTGQALVQQLRTFGHLPYSEPAPTGYPTTADEWLSAGAMMERMKFALLLASGGVSGVDTQPVTLFLGKNATIAARPNDPPGAPLEPEVLRSFTSTLLQRTLPGVNTNLLETEIGADLARQNATDARTVVIRGLGLALGSPEFQRY